MILPLNSCIRADRARGPHQDPRVPRDPRFLPSAGRCGERMGMTPAPALPDAIRTAKRFLGELPVPLVIPDAGYVLPDPAG